MLHTWVSLIIVAQYGLVWKKRSNTCVMCICFLLFISIVSDSGSDSVLLGPPRNVLCQMWELNEIHWLWCDDVKSLCGKQMKYILYQLIIHHEQTKKSVMVKYCKTLFHILYFPVDKTSYYNFKIIYSVHFESVFSFHIPTKCTYNEWY